VTFLPDSRRVWLIRDMVLVGLAPVLVFTFLVAASTLGKPMPQWLVPTCLVLTGALSLVGLGVAIRDRLRRYRVHIDAFHVTQTIIIAGRERHKQRWPIAEVGSIDTFGDVESETRHLALRTVAVQAETAGHMRAVARGEQTQARAKSGFLSFMREILGNRIGPRHVATDVATQLEIVLNAAIECARAVQPGV
jgi:hypothetical protein